jgi:16S rRNA (adenine1518-N6/adenine1519-N6)-dimethyltransferase
MRQKLGQHFLKNNLAIKKIIAAINIQSGDVIIEIGPGTGALTFPLMKECAEKKCPDSVEDSRLCRSKLIAIEKDELLAKNLGENIQLPISNFQIIKGDVIKVLPKLIDNWKLEIRNWKLVGNIPYYITGKLLRIISELKYKPKLTVLMIQKEVAERIIASPPRMNLLAAATQFWAKPEIILKLKPADFDPAPEVDSAVIKLTTKVAIPANEPESRSGKQEELDSRFHRNDKIKNENSAKETENYYKLIHIIFKQPRKTLLNNLKDGTDIPKEKLEKLLKMLNLSLNCRPQNLTIDNIIKLTNLIYHSAPDAEFEKKPDFLHQLADSQE